MKRDEFENHPVWEELDVLKVQLEGDLQTSDDDEQYWVQRLHAVAEHLDILARTDPVILEPDALQEISSRLTAIQTPLNTYLSNPTSQQQFLQNAAERPVEALFAASRKYLPPTLPDEAQGAIKAAATRYRNSIDEQVKRMILSIDELQEELETATQQRAADQQKASDRLEELARVIRTHEDEIDRLTTKLNSQVDSHRSSFENETDRRSESFRESQQSWATADAERVEKAAKDAQEGRDLQQEEAAALLKQLELYNDQAAKLVDTTSRHAVAGDYGTWSSHQARAGFWWTVIAVTIGLGTIVVLIFAVASAADDSVQFTAYKTTISFVGLIVAGYAAKQAAEHRQEERTAKRLALDLAALEPFLEQIENPGELRREIANRVFVPERQSGGDREVYVRTKGKVMPLKELVDLLKELRG